MPPNRIYLLLIGLHIVIILFPRGSQRNLANFARVKNVVCTDVVQEGGKKYINFVSTHSHLNDSQNSPHVLFVRISFGDLPVRYVVSFFLFIFQMNMGERLSFFYDPSVLYN